MNYNIEFGHIYAHEELGWDQRESVRIVKELCRDLARDGHSFVLSVLIDDFNAPRRTLRASSYLASLAELGAPVDFVGYESRFVPTADGLIERLPPAQLTMSNFRERARRVLLFRSDPYVFGLREHSSSGYRHTCAILSASWALCRLGYLPSPRRGVVPLDVKNRAVFSADRTLTILPRAYQRVEQKVNALIRASPFSEAARHMSYQFI